MVSIRNTMQKCMNLDKNDAKCINAKKDTIYQIYIKRFLDFILSLVALVVLSPVLAITGLLVRIKLGSPVVFRQARPGKNEKIFYLYKFRSMTNEVGEDGRLLPDAQRLTKFGRFLRASSLDELLELVNIIKGDMSIVGPRPLSIYYLPHYPTKFRRRHEVRPGLTGLAQVNGRNSLPWDDRFEMDLKYVDNISFLLDVKIIMETALKVIKHSDISVRGTTKVKDYGPYSILKEESGGGKKEAGMTYSEIGSYFWLTDESGQGSYSVNNDLNWLPSVGDSCFTFSGRNAIDVALRDILSIHSIQKVYAPSYCCVSMLQSFIDRGLSIEFYNVNYCDEGFVYEIPNADKNSIVLIMSYFGLDIRTEQEAIRAIHEKGAVIIEDITHSLLRDISSSEISDYYVASLRKWFAIPTGGWVGKRSGKLSAKPDLESNHAVSEKIAGMKEKYEYLIGKIDNKEGFLLTQAKFDNDLIHVDRMLKIDDTSLNILQGTDVDAVSHRRRQNAAILIEGLKDLNDAVSLPVVDFECDTPLFLPIFMKTYDRDSLRKHLINRGIYCPIHWPEVMGAPLGIRANELSLICDQRYTEGDMVGIVHAIHEWYQSRASE